jgi:hypothetical protein
VKIVVFLSSFLLEKVPVPNRIKRLPVTLRNVARFIVHQSSVPWSTEVQNLANSDILNNILHKRFEKLIDHMANNADQIPLF